MKASREDIRGCVIESLQRVLDKPVATQIDDNTNPIQDFGLESADGVDYPCVLSERLRYVIPHDVNPFVDDSGRRARKVGEIVDLMCSLLANQEVTR